MVMGRSEKRFRVDYFVAVLMYLLAIVSLFVIATATRPLLPASDALYFVKRQLLWIGLGTVVLIVVTWIDYVQFKKLSPYLYGLVLVLLAVVLVHGKSALGASRWIAVGPFDLQPSELAKPVIIVALATHLTKKKSLTRWRDLVSPLLLVGVPMMMILKQPDLGTTLVFTAVTAGMFYMAGVPWTKMLIFPAGLGLMIVWVWAHYRFGIPIFIMHTYQLNRLLIFLNPYKDPFGNGYNVIQSEIAVGAGGLLGHGFKAAHSNILGFVPESYTDFIFAPLAETLGLAGTAAILGVYLMLLARGTYIASRAKDPLGTLLASGVVAMFAFHVLESAGMATGMLPVAGVPLPFMSYGGSAFLADSVCVGMLLNVYGRHKNTQYKPAVAQTVVGLDGHAPDRVTSGMPADSDPGWTL